MYVTSRTTTAICKLFQPALTRWTSPQHRFSCSYSLASPLLFLNTGCSFCIQGQASSNTDKNRQKIRKKQSYYKSTFNNLASKHSFNRSFGSIAQDDSRSMDLKKVVSVLEDFAPTSLAGSWDNVGLLVEPTPPHIVSTICLTNDLTEEVLAEAVEHQTDLILSYHPPIFVPLKRLTMRNVKEKIIVAAVEKRIAIYSPHTAFDAVDGGVNDWLVEGLGDLSTIAPLEPSLDTKGDDFSISMTTPLSDVRSIIQKFSRTHSVTCIATNDNNYQITCSCTKSDLCDVLALIESLDSINPESVKITQLSKMPLTQTGVGRMATLLTPTPVSLMVKRIKTHLMIDHVQIALGQGKTLESEISTVGVCAGSGASVLKNVKADMFLTGEMSHHDILAAVAVGTTVVVCNHSNTERGFLHVLQRKLTGMLGSRIKVFVSEKDRDPLQVM